VKRWTKQVILAVAAGATVVGLAFPARLFAQTATPAPTLEESKAADLQQLVAVLNDFSADTKARDEAAKRLVSRRSPEAQQILSSVLVNAGNPRGQLAVARALADNGNIDPGLIDPLFALIGADRALTDAACEALTHYKNNPAVLNRLIEAAQNTRDNRETARASAARAVGAFADKRGTKLLIDLLQSPTEPLVVRNAAADGLIDMTGLTENGRDMSLWVRWWVGQSAKSDAAFRDDMLLLRSAQADSLRQQQDTIVTELESLLKDQHQAVSDAAKDAQLLKWFNSPEPQVRRIAAALVVEDFQFQRPFGPAINEQLRKMVGDSSPAVRLQVAVTLKKINDKQAVDALLTQLAQEPVAENRAALALALAQSRDLRAVPELEKLLGADQPIFVAEAGATALASLGPVLYEKDPASAKRVAGKLREVLTTRTDQPGTERLREAVVEALVPLRDPDMLTTYFKLLNLRETDRVRGASLRGLAALGDNKASDIIVSWLKKEPVPAVRLEAVKAIGATGGIEQFETLYERMQPLNEANPDVRTAAWNVFASLLPQASTEQINRWPGRFQFDAEKRVVVLKALADKFQQDKKLQDLAQTQQSIGEAIMKISSPTTADEAKDAATYFRLSLDFFQQNNFQPMVIEGNITQLLQALLQSKQYVEACTFAANLISQNAGNQQTVGPKFKIEAERLFLAGDLQSAQKLINEIRTMKPGLDTNYMKQLTDIERDIQQRLATPDKNGGTMVPLNRNTRVG